MARPIEGILPALHTAFDAREDVDWAAERALVRRLLGQGVQGLFACGTSGEFPFLSLEEREKLAELVVEEAAGRAAVVVHVGGPRPRDAARLAERAGRAGADAVCAVPPYYYSYREDAVVEYATAVASATGLPFFYYHIPERTGVTLEMRLLERLLAVPGMAGLKYSWGDLVFQQRIHAAAGPSFRVLCGVDELLFPSLCAGAAGAVGSTYHFLAPVFLRLWEAFRAGRLEEARALQTRANRVIDVLLGYPGIAGSKEAMRVLGVDLGQPRRPQSRLTKAEAEALRREVTAAGLLLPV